MVAKSLLRFAPVLGLCLLIGACAARTPSEVQARGLEPGTSTQGAVVSNEALAPGAGSSDETDVPTEPAASSQEDLALAVATNGEVIAAAYRGGRVALLAVADGSVVQELELGLGEQPWRLAFDAKGTALAGLDHTGKLRVWELERASGTGRARGGALLDGVVGIEKPRSWPFGATLLWAPGGQRLVVVQAAGGVSMWDRSGELVNRWTCGHRFGTDASVAWSRDGSQLFCAEGTDVVIRDGASGEPLDADTGLSRLSNGKSVVTLVLHPTENHLATGHPGSDLAIWDLDTGALLAEAKHQDEMFPEPDDEVASIAWSPSGHRLAISIRDGCTAFELDPKDLTQVWSSGFLGGHFGEAVPVRWGPAGRRLWYAFECGADGLFHLDPSPGAKAIGDEPGLVPVFADDFGVTISDARVRVVELDGSLRW